MAVKNASPVAVKGPKLVGIKKDKTKRKSSDDKSIEVPKQKAVKTDGKSKAKSGGKKDKVAKIVKVESEEPAVAKNRVRLSLACVIILLNVAVVVVFIQQNS